MSTEANDLSSNIPNSDGRYGRGFRDALESVSLALVGTGVSKAIIDAASTTALDAYGNNNVDSSVPGVEIEEVLVVTTGHVTEEERDALDKDELKELGTDLILSMSSSYGWMLYIPKQPEQFERTREQQVADYTGRLSEGFSGVLKVAVALGINYVRFDRDADQLEGVPTYDW